MFQSCSGATRPSVGYGRLMRFLFGCVFTSCLLFYESECSCCARARWLIGREGHWQPTGGQREVRRRPAYLIMYINNISLRLVNLAIVCIVLNEHHTGWILINANIVYVTRFPILQIILRPHTPVFSFSINARSKRF